MILNLILSVILKLNLILKLKMLPLYLSIVYHDADYKKYYNTYNVMTGIAQLKAFSCAKNESFALS